MCSIASYADRCLGELFSYPSAATYRLFKMRVGLCDRLDRLFVVRRDINWVHTASNIFSLERSRRTRITSRISVIWRAASAPSAIMAWNARIRICGDAFLQAAFLQSCTVHRELTGFFSFGLETSKENTLLQ
jgi:hypothetical protein